MDTIITGLNVRTNLKRTVRQFSGEFINPTEFFIAPAKRPQVIAYWELTVVELEEDGLFYLSHVVRLASIHEGRKQKSKFVEDYHSDLSGNSLLLIPREILVSIGEETGESVLESYDFLDRFLGSEQGVK